MNKPKAKLQSRTDSSVEQTAAQLKDHLTNHEVTYGSGVYDQVFAAPSEHW